MVGLHFDRLEARESAGLIAKMRRSINVISLASTGIGDHYSTRTLCTGSSLLNKMASEIRFD